MFQPRVQSQESRTQDVSEQQLQLKTDTPCRVIRQVRHHDSSKGYTVIINHSIKIISVQCLSLASYCVR